MSSTGFQPVSSTDPNFAATMQKFCGTLGLAAVQEVAKRVKAVFGSVSLTFLDYQRVPGKDGKHLVFRIEGSRGKSPGDISQIFEDLKGNESYLATHLPSPTSAEDATEGTYLLTEGATTEDTCFYLSSPKKRTPRHEEKEPCAVQ